MTFPLRALSLCLAAWLALLSACTTDALAPANPVLPDAATAAQLRAADTLTITLQSVPDPSTHQVQIDDQGHIALPYIGVLPAAGASPGEFAQRIRQTYLDKKIYLAVDVSVSVTERYIYVGGEVVRPGRIVWSPDLTAAKAVQAAGGFTLYARENRVALVRDQRSYAIDLKLAQREPAQDPRLVPGDSLQVPRSVF